MSPTTPMAPTACPALSWIGRGEARLAQHRLVALAREPALEDDLELAAQSRGGQRAVREPHRRLLGEGRRARWRARRRASPCRAPRRGRAAGRPPRAPGRRRRAGRRGARRPRRAVQHADAHRGLRLRSARRSAWTSERAAQLVEVEVGVAEMQQPRPELVLVGVAVLLDEAVRLERLQQAVDGRPRHAELVGQLRHPSRRGPAASALRIRAARSTDWIVPAPAGGRSDHSRSALSNRLRDVDYSRR